MPKNRKNFHPSHPKKSDLIAWLQDSAIEDLQNAVKACVEGGIEVMKAVWEWLMEALDAAIAGGRALVKVRFR